MVKTTDTGQETMLYPNAAEEIEKDKNANTFLNMLASIEPVKAEYSAEEMVAMLRAGKE